MYTKIDRVKELRTAVKAMEAGMEPCAVCKSLSPAIRFEGCMSSLLEIYVAARRERRVRHTRRVGNLIMFPSRT
jgi:hypothetical protein